MCSLSPCFILLSLFPPPISPFLLSVDSDTIWFMGDSLLGVCEDVFLAYADRVDGVLPCHLLCRVQGHQKEAPSIHTKVKHATCLSWAVTSYAVQCDAQISVSVLALNLAVSVSVQPFLCLRDEIISLQLNSIEY